MLLPLSESLTSSLTVSAVSPSMGAIGGNTLVTITGEGFATAPASRNLVFLRVPISTTFLK